MSDIEITQADIHKAAIYWVGGKDRETSLDDINYFEGNWMVLSGMRRCVEAFARYRIAAQSEAADTIASLRAENAASRYVLGLSVEEYDALMLVARAALEGEG